MAFLFLSMAPSSCLRHACFHVFVMCVFMCLFRSLTCWSCSESPKSWPLPGTRGDRILAPLTAVRRMIGPGSGAGGVSVERFSGDAPNEASSDSFSDSYCFLRMQIVFPLWTRIWSDRCVQFRAIRWIWTAARRQWKAEQHQVRFRLCFWKLWRTKLESGASDSLSNCQTITSCRRHKYKLDWWSAENCNTFQL